MLLCPPNLTYCPPHPIPNHALTAHFQTLLLGVGTQTCVRLYFSLDRAPSTRHTEMPTNMRSPTKGLYPLQATSQLLPTEQHTMSHPTVPLSFALSARPCETFPKMKLLLGFLESWRAMSSWELHIGQYRFRHVPTCNLLHTMHKPRRPTSTHSPTPTFKIQREAPTI